jgi:drug/metabolite transporter (DMT)-like permease
VAGLVGLIGVGLLFHPSSAIASIAGLMGLISGMLAGLAHISVKKLSSTEPGLLIVILFAFFGSIFSLVPMLFEFTFPDGRMWLMLLAIGSLGNLGQLTMARAYRLAPASQVSPLGYSGLIFAGLIGFLLWREAPDQWMLIGSIFIVAAGLLVARESVEPLAACTRR